MANHSPAEYIPWSRVDDIDVPVQGHTEIGSVRVPWVCARDAEAVPKTAIVVAHGVMTAILAHEEVQRAGSLADQQLKELTQARYDPPLVHFYCSGCEETWDAWVNADGMLQDPRDVACANGGCSKFRHPATLVDEDG